MRRSPAIERRRAFTLIELLVSMVVLALLVTLLAGVFSNASRIWIAGEGGIERRRSHRAITDFIGNELRSAVAPVNRASTVGQANLQFFINPPDNVVPSELFSGDSIFWQAPIAYETTYGDLAAVGYFVRWIADARGSERPALCRFFVNPSIPVSPDAETGTAGGVMPNPLFRIYTEPRWLDAGLLDQVAPARAPAYRGLFAENVLGFWVRAFKPDGEELLTDGVKTYDSRVGYKSSRTKKTEDASVTDEDLFLPARVEISLAQIDSHTAAQLDRLGPQLRELAQDPAVKDAGDFLAAARAQNSLSAILPGLQLYFTDVRLENAR